VVGRKALAGSPSAASAVGQAARLPISTLPCPFFFEVCLEVAFFLEVELIMRKFATSCVACPSPTVRIIPSTLAPWLETCTVIPSKRATTSPYSQLFAHPWVPPRVSGSRVGEKDRGDGEWLRRMWGPKRGREERWAIEKGYIGRMRRKGGGGGGGGDWGGEGRSWEVWRRGGGGIRSYRGEKRMGKEKRGVGERGVGGDVIETGGGG